MVLNFDCFKDTLHFINEHITIDAESKEMKPLKIKSIYNSNKLSNYSEVDIYYAICCLADIGYIVLQENLLKYKRQLIEVRNVTMAGQNFYYSTLEPTVWESLKNKAKTLGDNALKFIGDTVQKCAVTATATAATVVTNKLIDGQ